MNYFIQQLRETALELKPFAEGRASGSMSWNGKAYVKSQPKAADPYALAWWFTLNAIADLLQAQSDSPNELQVTYLEKLLFGGMGSFNDLYVDEETLGEGAKGINERLSQKRRLLFNSLKALRVIP